MAPIAPRAALPMFAMQGGGGDRGSGGRGSGGGGGRRGRTLKTSGALNRQWALRRKSGEKITRKRRSGSRAKRAEGAGDTLYTQVSIDPSVTFPGLSGGALDEAALSLLESICGEKGAEEAPAAAEPSRPAVAAGGAWAAAADAGGGGGGGGVMWGPCSVGPMLRTRLLQAGLAAPLPIQEAAFPPIARGKNVLLSSQTGSGKTLAFLLPLLSILPRKTPYQVLVVCPSIELARQLRRSVDLLWPPAGGAPSALHIVRDDGGDHGENDSEGRALLAALNGEPLLAGTPYALRALVDAANAERRRRGGARRAASASDVGGGDGTAAAVASAAALLCANLRVVVLDEADQLLRSDAAAVQHAWRSSQPARVTARQRATLKAALPPSPTEELLRTLPKPLHSIQLLCATATAGRTLRRQLQPLVGAASIADATEVVTPAAGAFLTPTTISHACALWRPDAETVEGGSGEADGAERASTEARRAQGALAQLAAIVRSLPPAAAVLFAERSLGTAATARSLRELGFGGAVAISEAEELPAAGEGAAAGTVAATAWAEVPIYVVSEKWARGLDLPLGYALLPAPPATPAGYLHMSGRTGRSGLNGTAITLVTPLQVPRLAACAHLLGITFKRIRA